MAADAPRTHDLAAQLRAPGAWPAWRRPVLLATATVLALRVLLSLYAAFVLSHFPVNDLHQQYAHVGYPLQTGGLAAPWEREDALWYEKIASQGYGTEGSTAFFPLLPLLMRLVSPLTLGNMAYAGILVATLAAIAAFALLYRLADADAGTLTAERSVAYLALFPTAFFLYAAYTESLFLALTLGAFWCVRRGHVPGAILLAVCAGLTKVQGAILGVPLAVEYLIVAGWSLTRPLSGLDRGRVATAGSLLLSGAAGTLAYFGYLAYGLHDPVSWFDRESLQWQQRVSWPGETLIVAIQKLLGERQLSINMFDLVVLLLFTALAVAAFRFRASYGLQAATILVSTWFHLRPDFPLVSVSRYVLVAFPCFMILAHWAARRPRVVHLGIVTLWVSWLLVWTLQSIRGYWVG